MVNVQKLKGLIVEKGTTQQAVADSIGIDRSTFYRKMKNGRNFSLATNGIERISHGKKTKKPQRVL